MRTCLRRLVSFSVQDFRGGLSETQAAASWAHKWPVAGLNYSSAAQAEVPAQGELSCLTDSCIMFADHGACCGGLLWPLLSLAAECAAGPSRADFEDLPDHGEQLRWPPPPEALAANPVLQELMEQAEQYAHQSHDSDADEFQPDTESLAQAAGLRSPVLDRGTVSATPPSGSIGKQQQLVVAQLEPWPQPEEDLKVLPVPDRWAVLRVTLHNCKWGPTGSFQMNGQQSQPSSRPACLQLWKVLACPLVVPSSQTVCNAVPAVRCSAQVNMLWDRLWENHHLEHRQESLTFFLLHNDWEAMMVSVLACQLMKFTAEKRCTTRTCEVRCTCLRTAS